jgi:NAD+ synthase (glutamine-hydrolysing)
MNICVAQLNYTVGDFEGNTRKILAVLEKARAGGAGLAIFSELALCGYPPEDLLLEEGFVEEMEQCLQKVIKASLGLFVVVGLARKNPSKIGKRFFNSAAIIENGVLLGFHDKWLLPTYDVFDEGRYFEPGTSCRTWEYEGKKIAVLICEDIWQHAAGICGLSYARDPVEILAKEKIDCLINISASPYHLQKLDLRIEVCRKTVETLKCPLILCCQVGGNDQLIFDGSSVFLDAKGEALHIAKAFEEEVGIWDLNQKEKTPYQYLPPERELFSALVLGVRDYFHKSGFKKAALGLSGGIDSALVVCIAVEALGKENVLGFCMPSRYNSKSSLIDAKALSAHLGIMCEEISIEEPFKAYLTLLQPHFKDLPMDVTEENLQSRIRATLLMAFSNKFGYIVLSTGNKSEMALGYMTLYGDLCGGLSVISDLSKRQVYELARFVNRDQEIIPLSTIQKEPSAELRPNQKDSDSLPAYDLLDWVVHAYIEQGKSAKRIAQENNLEITIVQGLIEKIHKAEYKRRQAPPGLRVSQKSFREGRKVPIVQKWK